MGRLGQAESDDAARGTAQDVRGLAVGRAITASIGTAGEVDHASVDLHAGHPYLISVRGSGTDALADPVLHLGHGGAVLATDDDSGGARAPLIAFTPDSGGRYDLAVTGHPGAGSTGDYRLIVTEIATDMVSDDPVSAAPAEVGTTVLGAIESAVDFDVYAVSLTAGHTSTIGAFGAARYGADDDAGHLDTVLTIRDAAGRLVASSDDDGASHNAAATFTAARDGAYYLSVSGYAGDTGGYALSVDDIGRSRADPTRSIDWGTRLPDGEIRVWFVPAGAAVDGTPSLGWSDYEIARVMAACRTWSDVCGVTFAITDDPMAATFRLATTRSDEFVGALNPPGEAEAGAGLFAINGAGWNTHGGLERGGAGFATLVHEIGHGLGLAHPHDRGGGSAVMIGVTDPFGSYGLFDLDQGVFTVMSYNDGWPLRSDPPADDCDQAGPMALDIALAQAKYGAVRHNAGDTSYRLGDAGIGYTAIWDSGGTDTIRHDGARPAHIDLHAATIDYSPTGGGVVSHVEGVAGGYTIARGAVIENATGGDGDDTLTGNAGANRLDGRAGADLLVGGGGNDIYVVDDPGDRIVERHHRGIDMVESAISFSLPNQEIEALRLTGCGAIDGTGNRLANALYGNDAANRLDGGRGADTMTGGRGDDHYRVDDPGDRVIERRGGGDDSVDSSVTFSLRHQHIEALTLTGHHAIDGTGNRLANTIHGNRAANTLDGGAGDDTLAGGGGIDLLTGGRGRDVFLFDTRPGRANADRIADFDPARDRIALDHRVFTALADPGATPDRLTAATFAIGTAACDPDHRIVYVRETGVILYDPDGAGRHAAATIAMITPGTALTAADFLIV
jgi:hypothetical protein